MITEEEYRKDEQDSYGDRSVNKSTRWVEEDIRLILSMTPNRANLITLSKILKRSHDSIWFKWTEAYSKKHRTNKPDEMVCKIADEMQILKMEEWKY